MSRASSEARNWPTVPGSVSLAPRPSSLPPAALNRRALLKNAMLSSAGWALTSTSVARLVARDRGSDPEKSGAEMLTPKTAEAIKKGLDYLADAFAIVSRGTRRDFVDLYLLCRELPLAELLERSLDKFGHVRDFPLQALKGLADLSEIEGEPMPRLARPLDWSEVEAWLRGEVREMGRARVGL